MDYDEGFSMQLPLSEIPKEPLQYPALSGSPPESGSISKEVCGEKRKSEENGDASGKRRKENAFDEEMPFVQNRAKGHGSSEKHNVEAVYRDEQGLGGGFQHQYLHSVVNHTTASKSTSIQPTQAIDPGKLKERRRLDKIVQNHIDDSSVVFDQQGVIAGDPQSDLWMMSGGLVTDPLQGQGLWDAKTSTSGLPSLGRIFGDGSELEVANQESSNLSEGSTCQCDNHVAPTDGVPNSTENPSPALPSMTSSPMLKTKQALRLQSDSVHHTRIRGPIHPRYSDRVMPDMNPAFTPTTLRSNVWASVPSQGVNDESEDGFYIPKAAGPVRVNAFGKGFGNTGLHPTVQPQSMTRSKGGPFLHGPSKPTYMSSRPAIPPTPRPIDDLVIFVGVPEIALPGVGAIGTPSSSRSCQGRFINRQLSLEKALTNDRAVLKMEKEIWTAMMGF
ncbi:hypothetical protein F5Y11DRAFT_351367 [Daldinia sp. FL1419]|nr:hypothetical protein F5Y11DRAFT_351367 [Daldinia sp. FL1419]